jgi:hypothetical protein
MEPLETRLTAQLQALIERTRQGDPQAPAELQHVLDSNAATWESYGRDLAEAAQRAWVSMATGGDPQLAAALAAQLDALKAELTGGLEDVPVVERLLVERIAINWLQTCVLDIVLAQTNWGAIGAGHAKFLTQFLVRAQGLLLSAVKALAQVRTALRPALSPLQVASRLHGNGTGKAASPQHRPRLLAAAAKN